MPLFLFPLGPGVAQGGGAQPDQALVRESFRQTQTTLSGLDVVVDARSAAGTTEPAKLRLSLERLWPLIRQRCNACSSP